MKKNTLWTKDFTIITVGSAISMLGNAMTGFAVSLFVLDYTDTPFLYALFVFLYTLPQIIAPMLSGPLMDRFSRRKTIYLLDFFSAALYVLSALLIYLDCYNFAFLAGMTFVSGTVNSIYRVAFDSFYPLLISEGNYSKGYSVSSTLETLSLVMVAVSTFLYKSFGIFPLLLANGISFLVAALFETQIRDVEADTGAESTGGYSLKEYLEDSREGLCYLKQEKGLLLITLYFSVIFFVGGASTVITLPFFRESFLYGEYVYMSVWGFMVLGRVLGGILHYRFPIPAAKKFGIAFCVYIMTNVLEGMYLYTPLWSMRVLCFIIGILGVTSYNIRLASTQTYVPHEKKGRFNGSFLMLTTIGSLLGQLLSGAVITFFPMRETLAAFMGFGAVAAVVLVGGGKRHILPVYNQET